MPKTVSATARTLSTVPEIMALFRSSQCPQVGYFAKNLKQAIKDCEIEDNRHAAFEYLLKLGREAGIEPLYDPFERE